MLAGGLAHASPLPPIAPSAELRYRGWTCPAAAIGTTPVLASRSRLRAEDRISN